MEIETRLFGTIEIEDEKIICFENGIIGFPDLRKYTLIYDIEKKDEHKVFFLQSVEDGDFALPVLDPLLVMKDYKPDIKEEILNALGELAEGNMYILVTLTATKSKEDMSVNLKAPIVINTDSRKACQVIVENEYPVKFKICDILEEKAGE